MKRMRDLFSMGLAVVVLGAAFTLYAPKADADVRVIRRGTCIAPGHFVRPQHVHTYTYQQQKIFIGYDQCGYPVYEIRYVRVRTCGCR